MQATIPTTIMNSASRPMLSGKLVVRKMTVHHAVNERVRRRVEESGDAEPQWLRGTDDREVGVKRGIVIALALALCLACSYVSEIIAANTASETLSIRAEFRYDLERAGDL